MKNKAVISLIGLAAMAGLLTGCGDAQAPQTANTGTSNVMLTFVEFEKNIDPYQTRVIVTPDFMRFDDGEGSRDFILFDRKQDVVYSVNSEEQTVMSLKRKHVAATPPFKLNLTEQNLGNMKDAPAIDGKRPMHYRFSANDEHCYDVVAVQGLLPEVVKAMQEFSDLLASDSKLTFNNIPADLHDACDMSMSTFAAGRHLVHGFPIQEWSAKGAGRSLLDYQLNYEPDAALFVLPSEFKHYSVQDFREGKVNFAE